MKQCIALAAAVCLLAVGCAQSRMGCGEPCQMAKRRPLLGGRMMCKDGCQDGVCPVCHQCACDPSGGGCGPCQQCAEKIARGFCGGGCGGGGICPTGTYPETPAFNPGPPVGQVAYPYYTVRGPRDFLLDKPQSIGP
jgi:hypothetical protein